jgi:hypothetical protein
MSSGFAHLPFLMISEPPTNKAGYMKQQTTKAFCRYTETGQILVIEKRWGGTIIGSCPATEPLRELDSYECTDKNNLWVMECSAKLVLMDSEE